jgi:2-iminobutanoate/2-iminopropanoate deaminase
LEGARRGAELNTEGANHDMSDVGITKFNADGLPTPKVPLSHGVVADGWLFCAGVVGRKPNGDIIEDDQRLATLQCLENMLAIVKTAGGDKSNVIKVNVYLSDFADYGAMNAAFTEFFDLPYPARTTIEAGGLGIGQIELDGVAYLGSAE